MFLFQLSSAPKSTVLTKSTVEAMTKQECYKLDNLLSPSFSEIKLSLPTRPEDLTSVLNAANSRRSQLACPVSENKSTEQSIKQKVEAWFSRNSPGAFLMSLSDKMK